MSRQLESAPNAHSSGTPALRRPSKSRSRWSPIGLIVVRHAGASARDREGRVKCKPGLGSRSPLMELTEMHEGSSELDCELADSLG
jgi:hypothetical protein